MTVHANRGKKALGRTCEKRNDIAMYRTPSYSAVKGVGVFNGEIITSKELKTSVSAFCDPV